MIYSEYQILASLIDYTKNNYEFLLLVFSNHCQQQTFHMLPLPVYQSFALLDAS